MEDEAICRVCRSESTPDHPLFHPCKCSGSIRFVHQDCLIEWLAHSKKKYCELCEYPFVFTPIYQPDMPDRLPVEVVFRQIGRRLASSIKLVLRGLVVAIVWLVILPYSTLWTWRFYFWSGETITMLAGPAGQASPPSPNITLEPAVEEVGEPASQTWLSQLMNMMTFPIVFQWRNFLSDCFEGQVITAVVIVVFIAAYLFREWVMQNLPLEEEAGNELVEEQEEAQPPMPQQPQPHLHQDMVLADGDDDELIQQQQVAIDTLLNAIHTIHSNEADIELERNELQARLNHMRQMLELKRQADEHKDATGSSSLPLPSDALSSHTHHYHHREEEDDQDPFTIDPHPGPQDKGKQVAENDHDGTLAFESASSTPRPYKNTWKPATSSPLASNAFSMDDMDPSLGEASMPPLPPLRTPSPPPVVQPPPPPLPRPEVFRMPPPPIEFAQEPPQEAAAEEDMEPFDFADDIDGVLEAVGMRGNPWMLLQNSVLMSLMVSLCLAVAVWIPYVVGRLVVTIKPVQFIQIPISVMRLITDPVVDFVLDRGIPALWVWVKEQLMHAHTLLPLGIQSAIHTITDQLSVLWSPAASPSSTAAVLTKHDAGSPLLPIFGWPFINASLASSKNASLITHLNVEQYQLQLETFASLALERWHGFAKGQSPMDRTVCILLGYLVLVLVGAWYLGRANARLQEQRRQQQPQLQQVQQGDTVHDILRQQGDFLKVVFFIVIELVIFPFACGVLLDLGTLPLFQGATVSTRWSFYQTNPYSSCFLHWFFGTGFLFGVAVFVALCREIVRPGVIWFIRDPNDPQFHPIREMIERPTIPLLQKILHSAMMYSGLIFAAVGVNVYLLNYFTSAFPLYVPFDKPFSTLALDLLAIQFLLSPLISYLQPRDYAKYLLNAWWQWTSGQLRLTSFFFGTRPAAEEGVQVRHTFMAWVLRKTAPVDDIDMQDVAIDASTQQDVEFIRNGQLLRVPKMDTVPVDPLRPMLVPVDPVDLTPLNENERLAGLHAAAAQSGDEAISTMIVYAPPYFNLRILLFIFLMWMSSSFLTWMVTVAPVCLGRWFFQWVIQQDQTIHDIYSFSVGMYLMVTMGMLVRWLQNNPVLTWTWWQACLSMTIKALFLVVTLGLIVPLFLGITVDLYLFMPLRYAHPDQPMVLHVSEDWAFGVAFLSIGYGILHALPTNPWQQFIDQVFPPIGAPGVENVYDFLSNVSLVMVTRSFLAPALVGSILLITIPGILAWGCVQLFDNASNMHLIRWTYPFVYCILLLGVVTYLSTRFFKICVKSIRDDTYLVGKQLHNLD
ncbi:hypothetical protein DM01DRAFT_1306354 [Hesseltinella vesiculosa]|uniref:RING-type E3 ubiquitin transferase n=1 Tax=Hesseltinella vesiculosa TaxID=101127 RepID=A0A1X2GFG4_9FUNG|nr:hypothetical protein DM01DRAFT_1306354 [Hesseltinella vesiculosa]